MKLASYIKNGDAAFGVVVGDGLVTLNGRLARRVTTLRDAIDAACYPEMARIAAAEKPDLSVRDVTFLPLIPNPKKILCVGLNYRDHVAELAGAKSAAEVPGIFVRFPGTLLGHGQAMQRPRASTMSGMTLANRTSSPSPCSPINSRDLPPRSSSGVQRGRSMAKWVTTI